MHVCPHRLGETLTLPQSLWLWSPLPPLSVRLGSVPPQACWHWSECVHWQMGGSTPTTSSPPPPGQRSPFPQRQIPSSRVKHLEICQKTAGTIWNGNPENWPNRKQFLKSKDRSLCRTDFLSWTRNQSVLMPVLCNEFNWFKSKQLFFFFFLQIDWIPQFIWTICS